MKISFPHKPGSGGPGSFQVRIEEILMENGWNVIYAEDDEQPDVIMIVGGTRKIGWLLKQKNRGVPILFRLDGINWLHRKKDVSVQKWLINEIRNQLSQINRTIYATHIIYQSNFVQRWWKEKGWKTNTEYSIIYNGVDTDQFKPDESKDKPLSLLAVEGNLDYSPYAVDLLNQIQDQFIDQSPFESLIVFGGFESDENRKRLSGKIDYRGKVSRAELPGIYNNAVYLSLDVNAACPNTVIEALASGIPVIGFDTGALRELVPEQAGEIVPYGSDPWELGFPDMDKLCEAALKVKKNWNAYSIQARNHAEKNFNIQDITAQYLEIIESEFDRKY